MSLQARIAVFLAGLTIVICVVTFFLVREFSEQDMKTRMDEKLEEQIHQVFAIGVLERIFHDEIQFLERRKQRPGPATGTRNTTILLQLEIPVRLIFTVGRNEIIIETEGFPAIQT